MRTCPAELCEPSEATVPVGVAPLLFAPIPHPLPSAAIPVDNEMLWVDHGWVDDSFDINKPYRAEDGSAIQFSAGLMYPSTSETIRQEMEHLVEELEAWGSGLAGGDFEVRVDGMGSQQKGKLNDTFCIPKN